MTLIQSCNKPSAQGAKKKLSSIIYFRKAVHQVSVIASSLTGSGLVFLQECQRHLASPVGASTLEAIEAVIAENTVPAKGAEQMRIQAVFAVKAGINGFLDASRRTYTEISEGRSDCSIHYVHHS